MVLISTVLLVESAKFASDIHGVLLIVYIATITIPGLRTKVERIVNRSSTVHCRLGADLKDFSLGKYKNILEEHKTIILKC